MMISLALALAAVEAPQERLDRVADQLRAGDPVACRLDACPRPLLGKTIHCGFAQGFTATIDQRCASRLNDDELAFVIAHEWGHVATDTRNERGADWFGFTMILRAGFNGERAAQVFTTLSYSTDRGRYLR